MAVTGAHILLYTSEPEALRAVFRDVFGWHHVDAGEGWLIFRLPPAELGVHPADAPSHEFSLMCDDVEATLADLASRGIEVVQEPVDEGFGIAARVALPGALEIILYEPRHPTAV